MDDVRIAIHQTEPSVDATIEQIVSSVRTRFTNLHSDMTSKFDLTLKTIKEMSNIVPQHLKSIITHLTNYDLVPMESSIPGAIASHRVADNDPRMKKHPVEFHNAIFIFTIPLVRPFGTSGMVKCECTMPRTQFVCPI